MDTIIFESIILMLVWIIFAIYVCWYETKNKDKIDANYKARMKSIIIWLTIGLIAGFLVEGLVFMVTHKITTFTSSYVPFLMLLGFWNGVMRFEIENKKSKELNNDQKCKIEKIENK